MGAHLLGALGRAYRRRSCSGARRGRDRGARRERLARDRVLSRARSAGSRRAAGAGDLVLPAAQRPHVRPRARRPARRVVLQHRRLDRAVRAQRRAALPLRLPAGRPHLAAGAHRLLSGGWKRRRPSRRRPAGQPRALAPGGRTLPRVEAQRRTALWSVFAALALIALKLGTGLATHSLGLISEAAHSGTDLIAALLTFFAVGVAVRPADPGHQYGHGKAEHLAALAEGAILGIASVVIVSRAIVRLVNGGTSVHATWYALLVVGIVIGIDVARTTASWRAARAYSSPALASNALHFGSDLGGSVAVLAGLLLVRSGHPRADAVAALFVAVLVLFAATRLMRRNVGVLMDRAPAAAEEAARRAIIGLRPAVQLRRLRMRQ